MVKEIARLLKDAGIDNSAREAEWLLEAVTGKSSWEIKTFRHRLDDDDAARLAELLRRRTNGEPLQYITGIAGFSGVELFVGPGVFIPRPETETVAEVAMSHLPEGGLIVDLGTGSGAIALAIAVERQDARIYATEQSAQAFQWAEKNRSALAAGVKLLRGDLFLPLSADLKGTIDVVVSNPPYVASAEARRLPTEVLDHEPPEALFAGDDGLAVIRRISTDAPEWLTEGGWLVLEIGEEQAEGATTIVRRAGFNDVAVGRDLAGRDRVLSGRWAGDGAAG